MKPIEFKEQNTVYIAPRDWDEATYGVCGDLPVQRDEVNQTVTSCWDLSDVEAQLVADGARIYLTIHGEQPPVMLEVRS